MIISFVFTFRELSPGAVDRKIIAPDCSSIAREKEMIPPDKARMIRDKEIIDIS